MPFPRERDRIPATPREHLIEQRSRIQQIVLDAPSLPLQPMLQPAVEHWSAAKLARMHAWVGR